MLLCQDWEEEDNFLEIAAGTRRRRRGHFPLRKELRKEKWGQLPMGPKLPIGISYKEWKKNKVLIEIPPRGVTLLFIK